MIRYLNVGSGDHRAPAPWINLDSWKGTNPDVVASILHLPVEDYSIRYVYCGHVLEHLTLQEVRVAVLELRRVTAQFGGVCVVGPDVNRISENPEWGPMLIPAMVGGNRWPGDLHQYISTADYMHHELRERFSSVREVPVAEVPSGWPVVDRSAGWQFAFICR